MYLLGFWSIGGRQPGTPLIGTSQIFGFQEGCDLRPTGQAQAQETRIASQLFHQSDRSPTRMGFTHFFQHVLHLWRERAQWSSSWPSHPRQQAVFTIFLICPTPLPHSPFRPAQCLGNLSVRLSAGRFARTSKPFSMHHDFSMPWHMFLLDNHRAFLPRIHMTACKSQLRCGTTF